jgi:ABC-type enterobactin transport system permease subunit
MRLRRTGTEPLAARSAYGLRRVLAGIAVVGGVIGAVAFAVLALRPGSVPTTAEWVAAGICLATVVIAVADLLVLRHRPRQR